MATYAGAIHSTSFKAAKLRRKNLAGTVKKSSAGIVRTIIVYKVGFPEIIIGEVVSTGGVFSIPVLAGTNDRFRIISIGEGDENSEIFENVSAEAV